MNNKYDFQYCQKLVIFSKDKSQILLCRRAGENDYDGVFSFVGGKMETTDSSIVAGIKREKDEEIGSRFRAKLYPTFSINLLFRKKDGRSMILPHYLVVHEDGEVELNRDEYSEFKWVPVNELQTFEPKIESIPGAVSEMLKLDKIAEKGEFILI